MPPLVNGFLHAYIIRSKVLRYVSSFYLLCGDLATREACLAYDIATQHYGSWDVNKHSNHLRSRHSRDYMVLPYNRTYSCTPLWRYIYVLTLMAPKQLGVNKKQVNTPPSLVSPPCNEE